MSFLSTLLTGGSIVGKVCETLATSFVRTDNATGVTMEPSLEPKLLWKNVTPPRSREDRATVTPVALSVLTKEVANVSQTFPHRKCSSGN